MRRNRYAFRPTLGFVSLSENCHTTPLSRKREKGVTMLVLE